ncbi:MAG: hypothetical protein B9J98_07400 [Candidatus Terraquivivens tikiterensis]|uniref:Uncharacterized protein n=1 Tax=Candidatus Terraquivivens tikiterensis TaxID=1980982 RepID=A0A2R7Y0T5_9ARCH|nr:MAG: hypothetical protein B9J98_07400 [Candidatus Terraquivivens tikiterensis]
MANRSLEEVPKEKLSLEAYLEEWLEHNISIISDDLLVIGRQVKTAFEKYIDLLSIEERGKTKRIRPYLTRKN